MHETCYSKITQFDYYRHPHDLSYSDYLGKLLNSVLASNSFILKILKCMVVVLLTHAPLFNLFRLSCVTHQHIIILNFFFIKR